MNQYNTTNRNVQVTMVSSAIGMMIAQYTAMFVAIMVASTAATTAD